MPRRGAKFLIRVPSVAAIVALVCLVMTGQYGLAQPLVLLSVMLAPALLPRNVLYPPSAGEPPDGDEGGGGGGRGPKPDTPESSPSPLRSSGGGPPLPDAQPAKVRRRDHDLPRLTPPRRRRAAPDPEPAPRRRRLPSR
jgi:hypothetical protein